MNTQVPEKFVSRTMFDAKKMIVHVDAIKDVCNELQAQIAALNQRVADLESNLVKKNDDKISTKAKQ